ncbi:cupredoxin domain-containing protein [Conexibacter sp. CPCC 206217]|uniref:cupredoxin domain-containing protein n=1 Tax=Conexibacter sp. CPCC 206217 TaxID=3064574 RepID=UPI00271CD763|nr:cupredoxin domain-containing protein [Conexibacter sp. CPCC 206217]MDO8212913.1 cupredoxin domain-containing protein [Conexibacter sp. CPCC 206217]
MSRRLTVLLVPVVLLAAIFALPAQGAKKRAPVKTVGVVDYAYTPARLTVRPGTRIVWKWDAANSAPHDVKLTAAPRGVRRFLSPTATASFTFARTLTAKGTYRLLCTFHATVMRQTIVVK